MTLLKNILLRHRTILLYGALMAILVFVLKWLQWTFLIVDNAWEIYIGLISVFFTALGIGLSLHLTKSRVETVVVEKEIMVPTESHQIDAHELEKLNLTQREYQVLQLMVKGQSNAEIAANLFLSLSTVKTHASNLFVKMDVTSRTKAIEKAKRLRITA
jgi:DNA-binding CsgD family transcriptional regulator